ncbi:HPP family protein [Desulfofalx alkaliphila]|uniref:HPP family protein n=1 Tax=Desulfofalx alkaliphila TaxID=105483 RepID=UPI00068F66E4|nr:HPP family protein [Desulfofalx alkaliphila]
MVRSYFCKMIGDKSNSNCSIKDICIKNISITALGSFAGIGMIAYLAECYSLALLLPSFGASAVLLYAACHVPMAQPRNVIGGHIISALMGVITYQLFASTWWAYAIGVSLAIVAMMLTGTLHPPGGATAFVAIYTGQSFEFIISPVGLGAVCLVLIALLVNNLSPKRQYPKYWY